MPTFRCSLLTLLSLICLCVVAPTLNSHAQNKPEKATAEQDQTIKVTTELIEIQAVVTDKNGKPIDGLTQDDFELLEEKKPQSISFFKHTRIAGRGATNPVQPTDPATILAARKAPPTRSVILFADTLHMSAGNLMYLKQALRKFVKENLTEQDLAAMVTSYGSLGVGEQLTRDRRLLRYAVEKLNVGPQERATYFTPYLAAQIEHNDPGALTEGILILQREEALDPNPRNVAEQIVRGRARQILQVASYRSNATLYTLRSVVERLASLPGQRLLVLFSDGFTQLDIGGTPNFDVLQTVTSRATRSGVVIYSVDAKGLQTMPGMSAESSGPPSPTSMSYSLAGESEQENALNALAADTGGKFFANTNDIGAAAAQALTENESYYTLAYYPAEEGKANQYRKLTVRVKNHPEYKVRAQKGYIPAALAKEKTKAATTADQRLSNKMLEPLASTEIGVAAIADDIEATTDKAQATLQVFLDGDTLTYQPQPGKTPDEISGHKFEAKIALMVIDANGKVAFSNGDNVSGIVRPDKLPTMRQNGLTYLKRLTLKPGFYQIRVGVQEPQSERTGTASAIVQIPDLKKKRLTLSGLFISDASPELTGQATDHPQATSYQAKVQQGIRFYRSNQRFIYRLCLYNNAPQVTQQAQLDQLEMQTEIWLEDKLESTSLWTPIKDRTIGQDDKGIYIGAQVILQKFKPGIYELRFNLRQHDKKNIIQRTAIFGVE